ncbi:hypothetical protein X736_21135 [Mesorhizobium sp. L2C089B000]|nr:hypothetical protein X736_21135 [Mesorhizobium sp. L2C089B000]
MATAATLKAGQIDRGTEGNSRQTIAPAISHGIDR